MTNDEFLRRVCRGTPSMPHQLKVLYNDGRMALVKHPGISKYGGVSPWVELHDTAAPKVALGVWRGKHVWDSSPDKDGRLTPKRLVALVEALSLNLQGICTHL